MSSEQPTPVGGEITPRDHGNDIPVMLSPAALLCPHCDWAYEMPRGAGRADAPEALWAHNRVAHREVP